ncbi:MAG TPA: fatty acid desaturase [Bacteroidales bacterium]
MTDSQLNSNNAWQKAMLIYTRPNLRKSIWQICNSVIPYVLLWLLMYWSLDYSYWITLLLSIVASGFLIRLFIIFHDCGHGSFFKSKTANDLVGKVLGILAFTPYYKWHQQHHVHHVTNGNLDKRGIGDVWTLTVVEYIQSSKWRRFFYRAFRNPFILFTLGPIYIIFLQNRLTQKQMTKKEKQNVYFTNMMLLIMGTLISLIIGLKVYLLIQLPVIIISHIIGLWLFYVQHQFDDVLWVRDEAWDYKMAAINGSSFLKLPAIFQWFTGNIGFHHVHHLSSRIPNYNLSRCHYENEMFKDVKPIVLFATFKTLKLHLWDEASRRMVGFSRIAHKTV